MKKWWGRFTPPGIVFLYCIGLLKLCRSFMAWAFKEEIVSWFTAPYIIHARNIGLQRIQNGNSVIQDDDWRTSNHQGPYLRWNDEVVIHGTCACQAGSRQIDKNKYHWPAEDLFYFAYSRFIGVFVHQQRAARASFRMRQSRDSRSSVSLLLLCLRIYNTQIMLQDTRHEDWTTNSLATWREHREEQTGILLHYLISNLATNICHILMYLPRHFFFKWKK